VTPTTYRTRADTIVVAMALLCASLAPRAWCQEGARILFGGGEAGGATNIYMTTPEGEPPEQLKFFDGKRDWATGPAWSPDGRQIAFSASREWVTPRIYVIAPTGPTIG
jgi:Tol biopolymer transport system component